jgi:ABC-type molybdate transport system permease subunit
MKTFLMAIFVGAFIGVLLKTYFFVQWSRKRRLMAQERSPMRTYIRVLIAVSMVVVPTGVGYVLGVVYGIFHVVVVEGGLAAGGHAISSTWDASIGLYTGMAIGAALGIGAAFYFWQQSKPG